MPTKIYEDLSRSAAIKEDLYEDLVLFTKILVLYEDLTALLLVTHNHKRFFMIMQETPFGLADGDASGVR
jgi:hypothetical protein